MSGNGGPAFPRQHAVADTNDPAFKIGSDGMSLSDYFATAALQGLLSSGGPVQPNQMAGLGLVNCNSWTVAAMAYEMADAMLAAREKEGGR